MIFGGRENGREEVPFEEYDVKLFELGEVARERFLEEGWMESRFVDNLEGCTFNYDTSDHPRATGALTIQPPEGKAIGLTLGRRLRAVDKMTEALKKIDAINGSTGGYKSMVEEFKFLAREALGEAGVMLASARHPETKMPFSAYGDTGNT